MLKLNKSFISKCGCKNVKARNDFTYENIFLRETVPFGDKGIKTWQYNYTI